MRESVSVQELNALIDNSNDEIEVLFNQLKDAADSQETWKCSRILGKIKENQRQIKFLEELMKGGDTE